MKRRQEAIGRSRTAVSNSAAPAGSGRRREGSLVQARELEMGHARALLGLADARDAG